MSTPVPSDDAPSRSKLVRDVLIFQIKLWLEGFKDIALMPLSLGAAVIDVVYPRKTGRGALYSVMKLGERFERWVHLYAALEEKEAESQRSSSFDTLDGLLNEAADEVEKKAKNDRSRPSDSSQTST